MTKKFDQIFKDTEEKMGNNKQIDFEKSSANKTMLKKEKKKPNRTERIQTYLSKEELKEFYETMDKSVIPYEDRSTRVRKLILSDIKKRKKLIKF